MKNTKTILLVGSEGFLGKNLGELLISFGYDIIGMDIQPNNSTKYIHFIQKNIFDISLKDISFLNDINSYGLIYTGGTSRNGIAASNPAQASHNTTTALIQLLELLNDTTPPKWMMLTSTREVDILLNNKKSLHGKQKIYSTLKLSSELIMESYQEHWNIPLIIFRLSDIFGVGDHPSKVIQIFLNKTIQNDDISVNDSDVKLYLTEVTEIASSIYQHIKEISSSQKETQLIKLWDDNYYITLLELAYMSLELNPNSKSKILVKDTKKLEYFIKDKIKPSHIKVLENIVYNLNKSHVN